MSNANISQDARNMDDSFREEKPITKASKGTEEPGKIQAATNEEVHSVIDPIQTIAHVDALNNERDNQNVNDVLREQSKESSEISDSPRTSIVPDLSDCSSENDSAPAQNPEVRYKLSSDSDVRLVPDAVEGNMSGNEILESWQPGDSNINIFDLCIVDPNSSSEITLSPKLDASVCIPSPEHSTDDSTSQNGLGTFYNEDIFQTNVDELQVEPDGNASITATPDSTTQTIFSRAKAWLQRTFPKPSISTLYDRIPLTPTKITAGVESHPNKLVVGLERATRAAVTGYIPYLSISSLLRLPIFQNAVAVGSSIPSYLTAGGLGLFFIAAELIPRVREWLSIDKTEKSTFTKDLLGTPSEDEQVKEEKALLALDKAWVHSASETPHFATVECYAAYCYKKFKDEYLTSTPVSPPPPTYTVNSAKEITDISDPSLKRIAYEYGTLIRHKHMKDRLWTAGCASVGTGLAAATSVGGFGIPLALGAYMAYKAFKVYMNTPEKDELGKNSMIQGRGGTVRLSNESYLKKAWSYYDGTMNEKENNESEMNAREEEVKKKILAAKNKMYAIAISEKLGFVNLAVKNRMMNIGGFANLVAAYFDDKDPLGLTEEQQKKIKENNENKEKLESKNKELEGLKSEHKEMKAELKKAQEDLDKTEDLIEINKRIINQYLDSGGNPTGEYKETNDSIAKLQKALSNDNLSESTHKAQEELLIENHKRVLEIRKKTDDAKTENQQLDVKITRINRRISALNDKIAGLDDQSGNGEIPKLNTEITLLKTSIDRSNTDIKTFSISPIELATREKQIAFELAIHDVWEKKVIPIRAQKISKRILGTAARGAGQIWEYALKQATTPKAKPPSNTANPKPASDEKQKKTDKDTPNKESH